MQRSHTHIHVHLPGAERVPVHRFVRHHRSDRHLLTFRAHLLNLSGFQTVSIEEKESVIRIARVKNTNKVCAGLDRR